MKRQDAHLTMSKPNGVSLTFEQAFEQYLDYKRSVNVRPRTLGTYKDTIKLFLRWIRENRSEIEFVYDLKVKDIRNYLNYLQYDHFNIKTKKKGLSVNTVNLHIRFLKVFYNYLFKESFIDDNPMVHIEYLFVDDTERDMLSDDELDRLLNTPREDIYPQYRDKVIMHLAYDSVLRISELIALDVEDINLRQKKIILPAHKAKGRKQRIIPINPLTVKLLYSLIEENNLAFDNPQEIFLNWHGERLAADTFRRSLARYVKKAGIDKEFSCHGFRRQGITDMLKNGMSIFIVQRIAGHEKIETTRKYTFFDDTVISEQHQKMSPMNRIAHKRRTTK